MNFLQDKRPFEVLQPYFIPAIYHRIIEGRKKVYQLSISFNGIEQIIKKSSKDFVHTGFNKVIMGGILRMEHLFAPENINLEVILYKTPTSSNLQLSFELVNRNSFKIGSEDYIASIMVEYNYDKMDIVNYYPIIYRQVCDNGQVSVMTKNFTESVAADKIFEIGCEWSRCTFETYQRKLENYYSLNQQDDSKINEEIFEKNAVQLIESVLGIRIQKSNDERNFRVSETEMFEDINTLRNAQNLIEKYTKQLGRNQFAVWNVVTELASQQGDVSIRNKMFLKAGKYLANEMEKTLNKEGKIWSENIQWNEAVKRAKN